MYCYAELRSRGTAYPDCQLADLLILQIRLHRIIVEPLPTAAVARTRTSCPPSKAGCDKQGGHIGGNTLWLGHAKTQTTEMYTRVDSSVKLEALESVVPPKLRSGRFKTTEKLIASLKATTFMQSKKPSK